MNAVEVARRSDARAASGRSTPLGEVGRILRRRWWQILIMFVLIVAAVAAYTLTKPKQYETHMKILVKNERANMVVSAGINAQSSPPTEVSETEINTEIELLNNNDLLRQVVTASGLEEKGSTGGASQGERRELALQQASNRLQRDLKILPVRKTDVIEVDYTAGSSKQAVAVLQHLASAYLEAHLRVHGTPGTYKFF
jgi:uncharacterized protein involved in exopolysaccharide biosynthesis